MYRPDTQQTTATGSLFLGLYLQCLTIGNQGNQVIIKNHLGMDVCIL